MDALKLSESLAYAIENDLPVMIHGDTGIGKTDIVEQIARKLDRDCATELFSTFEAIDMRGLPKNGAKGVEWSRPDFMLRLDAMRPGAVLFIDEANSNKAIELPMMQLILTRRIGPHKLPDGTRIVLAGNRIQDRAAAAKPMNKALEDRLFHLDYEASLDAWLKWSAGVRLHPIVIAFLRLRGRDAPGRKGLFIWREKESQDQRSRPGPRAWESVAKVVDAPDSIRFGLVAGRVGEAAAAELEGFIRVYKTLPPIPQLIGNPDKAPVPSEPSLQYAISVALGHAANAANLDAVSRYMRRVGKEFQTVTMVDAVRRQPALAETPAFIYWAAENSEIAI